MRLLRLLLPATFVALLLCGSGRAAAPTITLSLNQATLPETCAALSQAAGRSIRIGPLPTFPGQKPRDETLKRASFNWNQASLSRVLRDVCDRFELSAASGPGTDISLYPPYDMNPGAVPPPVMEVAATEKNGVRFSIAAIDMRSSRSLVIGREGGAGVGSLQMTIACRSDKLDRDQVSHLEHVIAKDDQGTVLTGEVQNRLTPVFGGIPDEFFFNVRFPAPHPRARRLVMLEAELWAHDSLQPIDLELPTSKSRVDRDLISIELLSFDPGKPFDTEANRQEGGPELRARITAPLGAEIGTQDREDNRGIWPALIDAAGKSHFAFRMSGTGGHEQGVNVQNGVWGFPRVSSPIQKIRFPLVQKLAANQFAKIALRDIPLPTNASPVKSQPPVPFPLPDADPKSLRRLPKVEPVVKQGAGKTFLRDGVQLSLQSMELEDTRVRRYLRPTEESLRQSLNLIFQIDSGNLDPKHLAGISNVRVVDDKGQIAGMTYPLMEDAPFHLNETRQQREVTARIPFSQQDARSLKRVEGDLVVYRDVEPVRFRFPSGAGSIPVRQKIGDLTAELTGEVPHEGGQNLHAQIKMLFPADVRLEWASETPFQVVGRSGKRYSPTSSTGDSERGGQPKFGMQAAFKEIPETVDHIEFAFLRRAALQRLYHFQIDNVPLPLDAAIRPVVARKPREANKEPRALFDPKGGALEFAVRIADSPAPEGLLQVALSTDGGGSIRRLETRVDDRGIARLDSVKPGNYRLLLSYAPDTPLATASNGRWIGSETRAVIQPGKTLRVPPLSWVKN